LPDLSDGPTSGNATAEFVKIGDHTFLRIGFNAPIGATDDLLGKYSKLFGVPLEIDICLVKEPAPPLGSEPVSYGAINRELPASMIRLRPSSRRAMR
jgi:hypothetical protein